MHIPLTVAQSSKHYTKNAVCEEAEIHVDKLLDQTVFYSAPVEIVLQYARFSQGTFHNFALKQSNRRSSNQRHDRMRQSEH
jgi:hypothetical protein